MSDFSGQGGDHGPTYIDVYGTANRLGLDKNGNQKHGPHGFEGPHPEGPFWLRGLRGELPLWLAFWGGFFFGHGVILAFSLGLLLFGIVFGLTIDPEKLDDSVTIVRVILGIVGFAMTMFVACIDLRLAIRAWCASEPVSIVRHGGGGIAYTPSGRSRSGTSSLRKPV